mgnify:CR=1 FL=1
MAAPSASALPNGTRVQTYQGNVSAPIDMAWVRGTNKIFFTEKNTGKVKRVVDGKERQFFDYVARGEVDRLERHAVLRVAKEDQLFPLDLREQVVLEEHDLDRQLLEDAAHQLVLHCEQVARLALDLRVHVDTVLAPRRHRTADPLSGRDLLGAMEHNADPVVAIASASTTLAVTVHGRAREITVSDEEHAGFREYLTKTYGQVMDQWEGKPVPYAVIASS